MRIDGWSIWDEARFKTFRLRRKLRKLPPEVNIICTGYSADMSQIGGFQYCEGKIYQVFPSWKFFPTAIVAVREEVEEGVRRVLQE